MALINLLQDLNNSSDTGEWPNWLFLFQKAFHTANHDTLLEKIVPIVAYVYSLTIYFLAIHMRDTSWLFMSVNLNTSIINVKSLRAHNLAHCFLL